MKNKKIALLGGDLRQMVTARALAADGFETAVYAMDTYAGDWGGVTRATDLASALGGADLVVLPLPVSLSDEELLLHCPFTKKTVFLRDVFAAIPTGCRVIGGKVSGAVSALAETYGIRIEDYLQREAVAIANAVPTAEGALAIAMAEVPYTIRDAECLVLGYGRIGKTLAALLAGVGARVTVAARKEADLAWIRAAGHTAISFDTLLCDTSAGADDTSNLPYEIVFNTVPKQIVGASLLSRMKADVLLLDLASAPGGIDRDYATEHGYHVIRALSLPGKTAPVTAGRIIGDAIRSVLKEGGTAP